MRKNNKLSLLNILPNLWPIRKVSRYKLASIFKNSILMLHCYLNVLMVSVGVSFSINTYTPKLNVILSRKSPLLLLLINNTDNSILGLKRIFIEVCEIHLWNFGEVCFEKRFNLYIKIRPQNQHLKATRAHSILLVSSLIKYKHACVSYARHELDGTYFHLWIKK